MSTNVIAREDKTLARLLRHMAAVREHFPSISYMKDALLKDDKFAFIEAWAELPAGVRVALWVAPSYGGIWTTEERKTIFQWDCEQAAELRRANV